MRRNTKRRMTPLQQTWFLRAIVVLLLCGLAWLIFFPGSGLLAILTKRKEVRALQVETSGLREDNGKLQKEIDRMQNDPAHLEEIARRDFGLLKDNERVYDFAREHPQQKK